MSQMQLKCSYLYWLLICIAMDLVWLPELLGSELKLLDPALLGSATHPPSACQSDSRVTVKSREVCSVLPPWGEDQINKASGYPTSPKLLAVDLDEA